MEDLRSCIERVEINGVEIYFDSRFGKKIDKSELHSEYVDGHLSKVQAVLEVISVERADNIFYAHIVTEIAERKAPIPFYKHDKTFVCRDYDPTVLIPAILNDPAHSRYLIANDHPCFRHGYTADYSKCRIQNPAIPDWYRDTLDMVAASKQNRETLNDLDKLLEMSKEISIPRYVPPSRRVSKPALPISPPSSPSSPSTSSAGSSPSSAGSSPSSPCDSCCEEGDGECDLQLTQEELADLEKLFGPSEQSNSPVLTPHDITRKFWTRQATSSSLEHRLHKLDSLFYEPPELDPCAMPIVPDTHRLYAQSPSRFMGEPPDLTSSIHQQIRESYLSDSNDFMKQLEERREMQKKLDEMPPFTLPDLSTIPKQTERDDNL